MPERKVVHMNTEGKEVTVAEMQQVYEEVKTPYKYGIVLKGEDGKSVDSPSIFRFGEKWYMVYVVFDGNGYESAIAESKDLLHWKPLGRTMCFSEGTWDANQKGGYIALQDYAWGGRYELEKYKDKYWMGYVGGALKGYETDPLAIGIAWTKNPAKPVEWQRLPKPVLSKDQPDIRYWEELTQYKSNIIHDKKESLGYPFVMFYNGKSVNNDKGATGYERIGMAVSRDMTTWYRYGKEPVIDNGMGISGDPQIAKIGDLWVMFYFGAFWRSGVFDTFACSYDLAHWTKWTGPNIVESTEPWDKTYAHKPWVIKVNDVVYHYYCAVGDKGRVIALATSRRGRNE